MSSAVTTAGASPPEGGDEKRRSSELPASSLDISIVIVARNEEAAIGRCVASAHRELQGRRGEVILVDSLSTDKTLQVLEGSPVTVLQITDAALISPSAGRFVGTGESRGKIVIFLDGDMVVAPGWIDAAVGALDDASVGAVGGWLYRVFPGEELNQNHTVRRKSPGEVRSLGGAGAYRREALEKCGTFHPFMRGEEERELCYRIRQGGYRILKIDAPMAYHLEKPRTASEINEKASYYVGMGQILRKHLFSSLTRDLIWSQRHMLSTGAGATALVACIVLALAGIAGPLILLSGAMVAMGIVGLLRKGMAGVGSSLRRRTLPYLMLGRGVLRGLADSSSFPPDAVRTVQRSASPGNASSGTETNRNHHIASGGPHR